MEEQEQSQEIEIRILAQQLQQIQVEIERIQGILREMDAAFGHLDDRLSLIEARFGRAPGKLVD